MHCIPIGLRRSRPKEVNKPGKHWACPQVTSVVHGEPVSPPDPVFLACTHYTAPPVFNPAACLLVKFYIYQSFLPTNLSRRGVLILSGNLTPQPFLQSLLFTHNETPLSLILPVPPPPTRESVILSSPLAFFHAHISSTLKEDT